jgi:hypothetical protein
LVLVSLIVGDHRLGHWRRPRRICLTCRLVPVRRLTGRCPQCPAHLICYAKGVLQLHPAQQQSAGEVTVLREAAAVTQATTDGHDRSIPSYSPTCARLVD